MGFNLGEVVFFHFKTFTEVVLVFLGGGAYSSGYGMGPSTYDIRFLRAIFDPPTYPYSIFYLI